MFTINEDNSIYANRGDIVFFCVTAEDDGVPYHFQPGDILRINIHGKKDVETVYLEKDFPVLENSERVELFLTEEDTKFGDIISKPKDYWYEVCLNPDTNPQTIIGYNEDGPAVFRLYPEGMEIEKDEHVPTEEDIPFVDEELDLTSPRPVANQAITAKLVKMERDLKNVYVTPEIFGAVGDGVADDTAAMRQALENHSVSLTPGNTYLLRETVEVPSGRNIEGNYATVKLEGDSGFDVAGNDVSVEKLRIVGDKSGRYGINILNGVKNTRVSDVYGEGLKYSLVMNDGESSVISGVYAYNCGWDCVSNYAHAKNTTVRDCFAVRCGRHGFSTDEGADGVRFINCTAEDIGWINGEGHTCFHLEGANNSKIINCRAVYTANHPAMSETFTGVLNGFRIEAADTEMKNNVVDGLDIIYEADFVPGDHELFALYFHSAASNPPTILVRNLYIKNYAAAQASIYHGNVLVHLDGFDITGDVLWKQQNAAGYLLSMKNGNVYQGKKNHEFYFAQYGNVGMLCQNVVIKNSKGLMNGRFVNCVIENCLFEDCSYSVQMVQNVSNSGEKSNGNTFRNNVLKDLEVGVYLGWWTGTLNNLIIDNILKGEIGTLLYGSYAGCVFADNIDGGVSYTTATHNVTPVTNKPFVTL